MKDTYKKVNKNSLKYKIRRWVILFAEIMQMIHYIFLWLDTRLNHCILFFILAGVSAILDAYSDFTVGRYDPLVNQLVFLITSYYFMLAVFPKRLAIIVIIVEIVMLVSGIVFINIRYYKGYPGPWWKQKWNSFYKKRTKKGKK